MRKNAVPLKPVSERGRLTVWWYAYIITIRSFLAHCEIFFEILGKKVAKNPKKTVLIALLGVALSTTGLLQMHHEKRSSKLFVPENSLAEQALKAGSSFFPNTMNTRTEDLIIVPKNGSNVFDVKSIREALWVSNLAVNVSGYEDICRLSPGFVRKAQRKYIRNRLCAQMNPLEIFTGTERSLIVLYRKLQRALQSTSVLMSNGRAAIFNIYDGFVDFKLDHRKRIPLAKALKIQIFLKQGVKSADAQKILDWEKSFILKMKSAKNSLKHIDLYFSAERSLDDAISESSTRDISLVSITFAVMITFSCLMLAKFINPVRGHSWLSVLGVLCTGMGILAGISITIGLGVPFINLVGVVPFLVVSIGIDDMFIIVDEFDRQLKSNAPENRVAYALSKVGATITMTTLTDVVAFFVSATSSFPAIRYFCIYTAICINIEFLLQISLFIAFLTFDARRIFANRNDCCPALEVRDRTCCRLPNDFSFAQKFMARYGKYLLSTCGKTLVVVSTLGIIAFGIYGCLNIQNEFNRKSLAVKGSYYSDYIATFEGNFPQTIPVSIQLTNKVDYSDPTVRRQISDLASIAHNTGYYIKQNFTWVHYYDDFIRMFGPYTQGNNFTVNIKAFLSLPVYYQHNLDVILNKDNDIVASRVIVFLKDNSKATFQKDAMLTLRQALKKYSRLDCTVASDPFIYFEQYAAVIKEVTRNLVAASAVITIMVIPFCIHPVTVVLMNLGFTTLIVEIFGLMYFWDIQLNAISMINIVMSIGFAVDYSAHIAHAFATSTADSVNDRIIHALSTVGGSVVLGGVSTFLGMSLTGLASSTIFQIFFKMFLGIILFGLYNGLAVLPVMLSIFARFLANEEKLSPKDIDKVLPPKERSKKSAVLSKERFSVSVTGMSTRFPTARSNQEFENLLQEGQNTLGKYPTDRHARDRYFESVFNPTRPVAGRAYVSDGSYLENIQRFDHQFFGISATEARSMDPQQRMLLQGVYESIEDAGVTLEELQQCITGVYVGIMNLDYSSVVLKDDTILSIDQFASTGTAFSIAANRISFSLNLTGPSIAIDTACSSSLTALSVACDHLERRSVDVAIVAAANLVLCPRKQITICRTNMLAPDGKCKVFDERANGYGRGEGVVAFVLKASDLVSCKDEPYCDILSWGVNNDGQTAAPITAPSVESQRDLMFEVLQHSKVDPQDVQYVEMHGTGTIIGDMVETKSVGAVYGKARTPDNLLMIGSVKSNINHTESAAGLAGLAKVCLMMKNEKVYPTVGIEDQAVRLDIEEKGLVVATKMCDWPAAIGKPKIAAINSFGYGGSNAHLILQEPTKKLEKFKCSKKKAPICKGPMKLFALSARSLAGLVDSATSFGRWFNTLEDNADNTAKVCYTLSERRSNHNVRLAVAAENLEGAKKLMEGFASNPNDKAVGITGGKTSKHCTAVAFVFGGQGSQWLGMADDILSSPAMLKDIKKVEKRARKRGHRESLLAYLKGEECNEDCLVTVQLSIFAVQYAVANFLVKSASIVPSAVGGHSLGDITAACVAGIIKMKQAVDIIMARASLQDECRSAGAMAAIGLSAKEVEAILEEISVSDQICIAAENDKANVTISGDADAIQKVEEYIESGDKKIFWRKLATHKAFHSHHMDAIESQFKQRIRSGKIRPRNSRTVFVSTTEGRRMEADEIDEEYWWRNLRNPVLFNQCITKMLSDGISIFIEISPRPVVTYYIKTIASQMGIENASVIQALPKKGEENRLQHLYAQTIGQMYTLGYDVSFHQLQNQEKGRLLRFPTYPWQEADLWVKDNFVTPTYSMNLIGVPEIITSETCTWENEFDLFNYGYLNDHKMKQAGVIMPGACYIEMALEASAISIKTRPVVVKDITFQNILPLNEHIVRRVKSTKNGLTSDEVQAFKVIHVTEQGDVPLSTATLVHVYQTPDENAMSIAEAMEESKISYESVSETDSGVSNTTPFLVEVNEIKVESDGEAESKKIESDTESEKLEPEAVLIPEDENVLSKLNFGNDFELLNSKQFNDLTVQTGFDFGETFSLIQTAWSADSKALVRLKLPAALEKGLDACIVHPCIIDACLQSCIAIGSKDNSRQVIPIGVKAVRLNPVSRKFHTFYGYAEIDPTTPDSCNTKLLNEHGDDILIMQGFQVKEMSRSLRRPMIESSLYEMNWIPTENPEKLESLEGYDEFIVLGFRDCLLAKMTMECLQECGVSNERILFCEVKGGDMVESFDKKFMKQLEGAKDLEKRVMVINLLPAFAHRLSLGDDLALTAQWLCFESTLMMLKTLSESELTQSKIVVFCTQSFEYNTTGVEERVIPWGSTALGLARVTNIETKIPVIPIDLKTNPSKEEIKTALLSVKLRSVDEGLIVSSSAVSQPLLQRVKPAKASVDKQLKEVSAASNFYVSWSATEESYCVKKSFPGMDSVPHGTVSIDLQYISSPTGSSKNLLKNIQQVDSQRLVQCALGTVTEIAGDDLGLQPGDEVIAVYNDKWLKDRVQLPVEQVFKKPPMLSRDEAAILPGLFTQAESILSKILRTGDNIKTVFIASNESIRGLSWALSLVASSEGLEVTMEDTQLMKKFAEEYLKKSGDNNRNIDCAICPSDLHPVDRAALINVTRKDGVLVILDNGFSSSTSHYVVERSLTVVNVKLLDITFGRSVLLKAIARFAGAQSQSVISSMPRSRCFSLSKICNTANLDTIFEKSIILDCIKVRLDEEETIPLHKPSMDIQGLKKDRSYIVIGGTKGLGLNTVMWMASRGAGTVIVVGRSEPAEATAASFMSLKKRHGTEIKFVKADVSTKKGADHLMQELELHPRLAGVVNSAAVIDDRLFSDVDRESYQKVMQPKVTGTLRLHEILEYRNEQLDFFVLYSSITAVVGNSGQSSYSAANAFMNSFADYRARVLGKPCLAVCWGAMGGGGILERNVKVAMLLEKSGLHLLDIPTGLTWLDKVLSQMPEKSNICICDVDWATFLRSLPPRKADSIIYDEIRKELPETKEESGNILEMILAEKSQERQLAILLGYIKGWVAAWISGSAEEIDCNVPMFTYGIDSVGATAIKGQIEKDLKIDFQVFYFMQAETTINKLAEDLLAAIHEKFIKPNSKGDGEEAVDEKDAEEDKLLQEEDEDDDKLVLPKEYLSVIYKPSDAQANIFMVHPSHRYSGVLQILGMGMRYQKIFSLYAFGWIEPSVIGEDIGSVNRLAKACIERILEVQPNGPYFLGGYSFGGLVALEMASIMKRSGKEVALVIMIDTVRWVPLGRNNSQLLINMIETRHETEEHIKEQMKTFFCKIATRKLQMTLEEYDRFRQDKSFEEIKDFFNKRAEELKVEIPDIDKIFESTTFDQQMSARCHDEWVPGDLYSGDTLYLEAEDDKFCKSIVGLGKPIECWASVLHKKPICITCPGDHYSMMDASRGPGIGKMFSVAAMLKFRLLFPNNGKILLNSCQKNALEDFKKRGMEAILIKKRLGIETAVMGKIKISKSQKKLKFVCTNGKFFEEKLHLKDVVNITKMETHSLLSKSNSVRNIEIYKMFAGLSLIRKNRSKFKLMCLNGQHYRRLISTLEAVYGIKLPF